MRNPMRRLKRRHARAVADEAVLVRAVLHTPDGDRPYRAVLCATTTAADKWALKLLSGFAPGTAHIERAAPGTWPT